MTGTERSRGGGRRLSVTLAVVVVLGAVSVGLAWSALNGFSQGTASTGATVLGLFGVLLLAALGLWLWRYLTSLLPEDKR